MKTILTIEIAKLYVYKVCLWLIRTIHHGVVTMNGADNIVLLVYKATSQTNSNESDQILPTSHIHDMCIGRSLCQAVAIVRVHQLR
jgi:hypothetical protein